MNIKNNTFLGFLIILLVIIFDQTLKYIFLENAVFNKGLALGLFDNYPLLQILIYLLTGTILIYAFLKNKKSIPELIGWSILMGGITSNLIDKIRIGAIIDPFVIVNFFSAFNFADISIILATTMIVFAKIIK